MRVSLEWLREFVELSEEPQEIAARLTMAGIEVEAVERPGGDVKGVIAARVVSAEPVPGKNLLLCRVEAPEPHTVICGDTTVRAGETVAYGPPGSLVHGREMGARAFGEVTSEGMLCSLQDMGLEAKSAVVLRLKAPPGTALRDLLSLGDEVWELNITPNRADCLSHWGVARELATIFDRKPKAPRARVVEKGPAIEARIDVQDGAGCPLYTARVIRGVRVGASPLWVRVRLEKAGMRSVNNVVDATNLVLLELGQPLHAFDFAKLAGGRIVVRRAAEGEPITLIDAKERKLSSEDLIIADAERPVALAGVMGGFDSEVSAATADLLLESAYFAPVTVRKSAKRHGLHTEASHRFERGVDPQAVRLALDRCAALIAKLAGGKVDRGAAVEGPGLPERGSIALRPARIERILGVAVTSGAARRYLKRVGCAVRGAPPFGVLPPSWRPDITAEIDLIEEVARLYGYDRIPAAQPVTPLASAPAATRERETTARFWMLDAGFQETVTYAFTTPDFVTTLRLDGERAAPIALGNPLTAEQSVMRTTVLATLLEAVALNHRRGNTNLRLFDLGRVFLGAAEDHREPNHLAACALGAWDESLWGGQGRPVDFYDLKGVLEGLLRRLGHEPVFTRGAEPFLHPGMAAGVSLGEVRAGWIGVLHPEVARGLDIPAAVAFEVDLDSLPAAIKTTPELPSRYPAVMRDVAFLTAAETQVSDIATVLREHGPETLTDVAVFDVYRGEALGGRKNLAFHLKFQARDRTLTDEEIDAGVTAMVKAVERHCGAELRAH